MDGKDEPAVVFSSKKKRQLKVPKLRKKNRRLLLILIILIAFVGVAYLLSINFQSQSAQNNQCNGKESSPLYHSASLVLNPSAQASLQPIADKIGNMTNYKNDPSCLYVLTVNYLNKGDSTNANKYYTLLSKVYNPKQGFVTTLGNKLIPYQTLTYQVQYAQQLNAQYRKSIQINTFKQPK